MVRKFKPERLREALKNKQLTQSKLAEEIGTTPAAISQWLAGKQPSQENLQKISRTLGGDTNWYMGMDGTAPELSAEMHGEGSGIKWHFRETPRDRGKDYGNSNIWALPLDLEILVREALQNVRDAAYQEDRPVRAEFRLIRLSGPRLAQFLEALQWLELSEHVQAAAQRDSQLARVLHSGLETVASGEMVLLRIEDSGTVGLIGDETSGHFASLVRNNLDSNKDAKAGGSYGLGKAVFWRSSQIATVVFNSNLSSPHRDGVVEHKLRLIAKTDLGYHQTDEDHEYAGPGWLSRVDHENEMPAASIWDNPSLARALYVDRSNDDPGTTILVPAFFNPDPDQSSDIEEMAEALRKAVARNFWPALLAGQMEVTVSTAEDGKERSKVPVEVNRYEPAYADALAKYKSGDVKDLLKADGDVAASQITVSLPARKADPKHQKLDHEATLIVRRDSEGEENQDTGSVVFYRGRGMIIKRIALTSLVTGAPPFRAVVLCGSAAGDSSDDNNAERFFRTAEPPAHNSWDHKLLAGSYQTGGGTALKNFQEAIRNEIRRLVRPVVDEDSDGPDSLRELLRITGELPPTEKIPKVKFLVNRTRLQPDGVWHVEAQVTLPDSKNWSMSPALIFGSETGAGKRLVLKPVPLSGCRVRTGRLLVEGVRTAQFSADAVLPPESRREIPTADTAISIILLEPKVIHEDEK